MITTAIRSLQIPEGKILFLHVCLRQLQRRTGQPYRQLTGDILAALRDLRPTTILVPAYTIYSFMLTGVFHRIFSRSEVGRFSEEVRRHFAAYRTPDPMYSVLDCGDYLCRQPIDYGRTFGEESLFAHLLANDAAIVNIGMEGFWSTLVHDVERAAGVNYRREKTFAGVVYQDEARWRQVSYTAFVREMGADGVQFPPYNRIRRMLYLEEEGVLHTAQSQGIRVAWAPAAAFAAAIGRKLGEDARFLVD